MMYRKSDSNPVLANNGSKSSGRWPKAMNNEGSRPKKRSIFNLSSLGKELLPIFSFSRGQARRPISKSSVTCNNEDGYMLGRSSSVKIGEHLDGVESNCVSAATSFKFAQLPGLSYVASFIEDYESSSYKRSSLEQAAKVVSSSSINDDLCSPISKECDSPFDVFASFSDGLEDSGSPLLDPELLFVFEGALEQCPNNESAPAQISSAGDCFRKTECIEMSHAISGLKGGHARKNKLSFGSSDRFLESFREKKDMNISKKLFEGFRGYSRSRKDTSNLKKLVSTICFDLCENKANSNHLLERFPSLCPPGGEHRVVLFFTSLRGIRTTFENCQRVKMALCGFRIKIDERDVSMHSEFKRELKDLLDKSFTLPRLFIKGRYIGGCEEVMQLNEYGLLRKFLEDIPRTSVGVCGGCADVRFVPCSECCGSRKVVSFENKLMRCLHCNENGLERCTLCC